MSILNFITSAELKVYSPNLDNVRWTTQADYSPQIRRGFDKCLNDLYAKGVQPSLINPKLVLKTMGLETQPTTGSVVQEVSNHRRLVVLTYAHSGTSTIKVQGSYDKLNWTDIIGASLTINDSDDDGYFNVVFDQIFPYFRYVSTPTSLTYEVFLHEAVFDELIIHAALILIYRSQMEDPGDRWDSLREQAEKEYARLLNSVRFLYDKNKNDMADVNDRVNAGVQVTFCR